MELPSQIPVMTLPSATLFPQALLPLYIFEPRYRKMLADALQSHRMFSVAMQDPTRVREKPCTIAGLGLIRVSVDHADGTSHLILQGLTRVELVETVQTKPYRVETIRPLETALVDSVVIDALVAKVLELVNLRMRIAPPPFPFPSLQPTAAGKKKAKTKASAVAAKDIVQYLEKLPSADQMADLVSCAVLTSPVARQTILATLPLEERLKHLIHFLMADIEQHEKGG
ncbi:MAG: LON peptidase substrate-binding domain-containing protein [Verrucomicrobia bacterium]|nr:LON peptidase substrate-binding domain-containing protein [Verrucomicrobiota bacterium]MBI3869566.1 LON peptidase substrate-binding domain-containing protein [Verrucomicrobiota bacterium]